MSEVLLLCLFWNVHVEFSSCEIPRRNQDRSCQSLALGIWIWSLELLGRGHLRDPSEVRPKYGLNTTAAGPGLFG